MPHIFHEVDINDAIPVSYGHIRCDLYLQTCHRKGLRRAVA